MKKIKIGYSDFWGELIPDDNYFYNLLSLKYNIILDNNNPDILFYTVYGNNHMRYDMNKIIKILYTGENYRPNYNECHYSLSFDYSNDERNYRLPLWVLILNWFNKPYRPERDQAYLHSVEDFLNKKSLPKTKFCSFIASQPKGRRIEFVPKLYQYKHIDCGGRVYNNVPPVKGRGDQIEKIDFLKDYKFNVCFENSSNPGYCTEKIIHSMFAGCLPIYWGDTEVDRDFNKDSFLDLSKFSSDEELISKIIEIDNNDNLYNDMMNQSWFKNNEIPEFAKPESVLSFFEKIIN
jgi:alpha(1,3/1,4) fucosyltransferase